MSNPGRRLIKPREPLYAWPSRVMWLLLALFVLDVVSMWAFWGAFAVFVVWLVALYRPGGVYGHRGRRR